MGTQGTQKKFGPMGARTYTQKAQRGLLGPNEVSSKDGPNGEKTLCRNLSPENKRVIG